MQSVFDDHSDHDDHADHDDELDPVVVGVEETALSLVDEDHEGHDHDEEDAGADVRYVSSQSWLVSHVIQISTPLS